MILSTAYGGAWKPSLSPLVLIPLSYIPWSVHPLFATVVFTGHTCQHCHGIRVWRRLYHSAAGPLPEDTIAQCKVRAEDTRFRQRTRTQRGKVEISTMCWSMSMTCSRPPPTRSAHAQVRARARVQREIARARERARERECESARERMREKERKRKKEREVSGTGTREQRARKKKRMQRAIARGQRPGRHAPHSTLRTRANISEVQVFCFFVFRDNGSHGASSHSRWPLSCD